MNWIALSPASAYSWRWEVLTMYSDTELASGIEGTIQAAMEEALAWMGNPRCQNLYAGGEMDAPLAQTQSNLPKAKGRK